MTRLKHLFVNPAWGAGGPLNEFRPATVSDLVAALQAEGGKVGYFIDMDADVPDEFSPGRYLVFRLEVDGV